MDIKAIIDWEAFLEKALSFLDKGLGGLCFLLMVLGYLTLNRVIAMPNPSVKIISLVKLYLWLTMICLLIVGIFVFGLIPQNQQLKKGLKAYKITSDILNGIEEEKSFNPEAVNQALPPLIDYASKKKDTILVGQIQDLQKILIDNPDEGYLDTLKNRIITIQGELAYK